jgi:hypothetical protein
MSTPTTIAPDFERPRLHGGTAEAQARPDRRDGPGAKVISLRSSAAEAAFIARVAGEHDCSSAEVLRAGLALLAKKLGVPAPPKPRLKAPHGAGLQSRKVRAARAAAEEIRPAVAPPEG